MTDFFFAIFFLKVEAVDADISQNGEIHFTLESDADGRFAIDDVSGHISVASSLSATDQNREFTLVVQATDQGKLRLIFY